MIYATYATYAIILVLASAPIWMPMLRHHVQMIARRRHHRKCPLCRRIDT